MTPHEAGALLKEIRARAARLGVADLKIAPEEDYWAECVVPWLATWTVNGNPFALRSRVCDVFPPEFAAHLLHVVADSLAPDATVEFFQAFIMARFLCFERFGFTERARHEDLDRVMHIPVSIRRVS